MDSLHLSAAMLDLLASGAQIQTIIDEGSRILGNPILVADSRYRILYMSQGSHIDIALWQRAIAEGYISDTVLADMEQSGTVEHLKGEQASVCSVLPNGFHAMRWPLHHRGHYCGFVGMYDYLRPLTDEDDFYISVIGKAVMALLPTNSDLSNINDDAYESLLFQLLRCESQEQADQVCRRMTPVAFSGEKTLIVVSVCGKTMIPMERVKDQLRSMLCRHVSVVQDGHLMILLEKDRLKEDVYQKFFVVLESKLKEYGLQAGVSFPFSDSAFLPYAYKQAISSIQQDAEKHETRLFFFENHMMDTVARLCLSQYPKAYYLHPAIQKLKAYDEKYHLDYLDTLKAYFQSLGNLKATAAALGVHYNTMKYRMSVIESITGMDIRGHGGLLPLLSFSLLLDEVAETED